MEFKTLFTENVVSQINREMSEKTQKANFDCQITFMNPFRKMKQTLMDYSTKKFVPLREAIQNSIDAQARNILIKAMQMSNGTQNIIFADDGKGMTRDILANHFLAWANEAPDIEKRIGGFGLGSIAVLAGKRNFVVTKSNEGTYVAVYQKSFFLEEDKDAYPFFVGPFDCSIRDIFAPGAVNTELLPSGNGTVIFLEDTNIFKKEDGSGFYTNKEVQDLVLKDTHAGCYDYLLPSYPADKVFPHFHIEVEDNNIPEQFYGYLRFVNYDFVKNYNKKYKTEWDLDKISNKETFLAFYNEIVANGENFKIIVKELFPQDNDNNDAVIVFFGNDNTLPDRLRTGEVGGKYVKVHNRQDFRGVFLGHCGLEIQKVGFRDADHPVTSLPNGTASIKPYDYTYAILTHDKGFLTSNRAEFIQEMDDSFNAFMAVGMNKIRELTLANQTFIIDAANSSSRSKVKNNEYTEEALKANRETHIRLPEIPVNTSNPVVKELFVDVKNTKCEKTTASVYEKLFSVFTLLGKSKILPTITGYITKKGGSYDAFVKSIDSYTEDEEAVLEFEYKLTDFKHPVDAVDYVACYTLGFPEDEEFELCGQTAKIITRKGRKYIDLEKRGFPIGLFIMEDYLNDVDSYLK